MGKIIGRQYSLGLAKESSRGTAVTTPTFWLPWTDLTIDEKQDGVFDGQAYGVIEDAISRTVTKQWMEGSITGNIGDHSFGLLLYAMLGTLTSHSAHSGESTVYDNVFNVAESTQHQSLTFAVHDPAAGQDYTYANGVVSKLELTFALKQFLQFNATIMGLKGATQSAYTPSISSENHFVPQYITFTIGGTTVKLKSGKITISSNVEPQEVLGSTSPADFLNKEFSVEFQVEAIWQNESDFKTAFMANTAQEVIFDIVNGDVNIGVVPSHPELKIDLKSAYITELGRPLKVKDLVYQTIKGKAVYSTGRSSMITTTLTSTQNGY